MELCRALIEWMKNGEKKPMELVKMESNLSQAAGEEEGFRHCNQDRAEQSEMGMECRGGST